ncbi:prolyl oligopeptidase family serine peptidase [Rapidithrix thailandica]|uniref:prolyl oligopeptidase n=1 Tax=Rapidithrix thailandica TaxID=413964 RepID=A0AAW9S6U2_9BACT
MKRHIKFIQRICVGAALTSMGASCTQNPEKVQSFQYPQTPKVDTVDSYFGQEVADPYRWLEDDNSEETKLWVTAQNELTQSYLSEIPFRDKIRQRLEKLYNYPRFSAPFRVGEYYFFSKNDGLQNQSVIYFQKGLDGEPEVFLDPNALSKDGTVTSSIASISKDDKYAAIKVNRSGSDWSEFYVMEVASRQQLSDTVEWAKFSGASWYKDGFYYSSYGKPEAGEKLKGKNEYHKIYYHKLGTSQEEDQLVFEDKEHPLRNFYASVTDDERYLVIGASEGTSGNEVLVKDLQQDGEITTLVPGFDFDSYVVEHLNGKLLVYTNVDAPNYRLVQIDPAQPAKENWKEVIAEKEELLEGVTLAGGKIFAKYLKDVTTRVYQYDLEGNPENEIQLPDLGSAGGFSGEKEDTFVFYTFTSFTYPPTIFKYDIASGKSELFKKTEVSFNPDEYQTKQVFYQSKDGTKVPMFLVHKKGLKQDGQRPTMLYGYGGFNISITPGFSPSIYALLENGGVYAVANIRGGGEYGEKWHKGGMLLNKQNVFDDFIAAGEYLISEKYTTSGKLAISGGSNGGLLVGACMTQRPDLFQVAFPAVGVLDMLRYHKFTIGWAWAVEYGSSEDEEHFKNLARYSPLHNVKEGVSYPATLVTTADHDDRVVPAHSFKFISELQAKHKGNNPVMIRIDTKAGHGSGKPLSKVIDEQADKWSFMFANMEEIPYQSTKSNPQ